MYEKCIGYPSHVIPIEKIEFKHNLFYKDIQLRFYIVMFAS